MARTTDRMRIVIHLSRVLPVKFWCSGGDARKFRLRHLVVPSLPQGGTTEIASTGGLS
jgi:hypothetical protein